jgi:hypothetical protein
MIYYATIRLESTDSHDVVKLKGPLKEVFPKFIEIVEQKGMMDNAIKKFAKYLSDDYAELARRLEEVKFG